MTNSMNYLTIIPHAADCEPDTLSAARMPGDTIASVWSCDNCEGREPFTDADFAFANTSRWSATRTFRPRG